MPKVELIKSKIPELGASDGPGTQVAQMTAAPAVGGGILGEGAAGGSAAAGGAGASFLETVPPVAAGTAIVGGAAVVGIGAAGLAAAAHNAHMTISEGPNLAAPGAPTIEQIERAYATRQAQNLAKVAVKPIPWVRITANPCLKYACGLPGRYRGGTYLCLKALGAGTTPHHTPSAAVTYLPYTAGPAVEMTPADHALTERFKYTRAGIAFQGSEAAMVGSGNFMGAVALNAADIHAKFPDGRYDAAVAQMLAYATCLKTNNFVR